MGGCVEALTDSDHIDIIAVINHIIIFLIFGLEANSKKTFGPNSASIRVNILDICHVCLRFETHLRLLSSLSLRRIRDF